MARVTVRIALEIILVLGFRRPEVTGGRELRHHAARPQARGVDILDGLQRLVTLRLRYVEDLRAIRRADIVALAIQRSGIVNLEEELQQVAVGDTRRVELDLDRLSVRSMVPIGSVRYIAPSVSNACPDDPSPLADQVLHTPEATSGEHSTFKLGGHERPSSSTPSHQKGDARSIGRWCQYLWMMAIVS